MSSAPLHFSYDKHLDWLEAAPFGTVMDRQGHDRWRAVSNEFGFFLDGLGGAEIGFKVVDFSEFDPCDSELDEIFMGRRFDAPALGLWEVTAGEVVLAAVPFLGGASTIDRVLFGNATATRGLEALGYWRATLQAGNLMAHYGAGYTLLDLGEPHQAYRHLRAYTELVPADAWAWAYRARAAVGIGEHAEALRCCEEALRLEAVAGEETDAAEFLEELHDRG